MYDSLDVWTTPLSLLAIFGLTAGIARLFPVDRALDEDRVARHLDRLHPGFPVRKMLISEDAASALVRVDGIDGIFVAETMGLRVVVRHFNAPDLIWLDVDDPGIIRLRTNDYTLPALSLKLTSPDDRDTLASWVETMGVKHA